MATVKINGKEISVEDGTLILDAARQAGFDIPTFCYQARLSRLGSCRMCLVEIGGQKKPQPSCVTPVLHGMEVFSENQTVMCAIRAGNVNCRTLPLTPVAGTARVPDEKHVVAANSGLAAGLLLKIIT